jgi:hypothetical protein
VAFIRRIKDAIYGPEFYKDVAALDPGRAWRYFFGLAALVSLASTAIVGVPGALTAKRYVTSEARQLIAQVPQDYFVTVKDGVAAATSPLSVALALDGLEDRADLPANLVVVDTEREWTPEMNKEVDALVVVAKDGIGLTDEVSDERFFSYAEKEVEGTLTYADVVTYGQRAAGAAPWILIAANVLLFLVVFLGEMVTLLWLLVGAMIVRAIASGRGVALDFGHAYRASLYLATLPILFDLVMRVLPSSVGLDRLNASWIVFMLLLGLSAYLNLPAGARPAAPAATPTAPAI